MIGTSITQLDFTFSLGEIDAIIVRLQNTAQERHEHFSWEVPEFIVITKRRHLLRKRLKAYLDVGKCRLSILEFSQEKGGHRVAQKSRPKKNPDRQEADKAPFRRHKKVCSTVHSKVCSTVKVSVLAKFWNKLWNELWNILFTSSKWRLNGA